VGSSVNGFLQRLLVATQDGPDEVPKGRMTPAQWAKEWGKTKLFAERLLRDGVRKGAVAFESYRVPVGATGRLKRVRHYYEV
jgi:hypothetical protein